MVMLYLQQNPPQWEELRPWYHRQTLRDIQRLHNLLLNSDLPAFDKLIVALMTSAVLRTASSQTKSWGHVADNAFPSELIERPFLLCVGDGCLGL